MPLADRSIRRQRMWNHWLLAAALACGVVAPAPAGAADSGLATVAAESGNAANVASFDGVVEAVRPTVVAAQVAGAVVALEVKAGDEIYGPEADGRREVAKSVRALLERTPGVVDVDDSSIAAAPRTVLLVDRRKAALLSVSQQAVVTTLRAGLAGCRHVAAAGRASGRPRRPAATRGARC